MKRPIVGGHGSCAGEPLARVPRVAWACAAVALLNGLAWSLITPPFEVPDENAHYAYVQQLAERGKLPRPAAPEGFFSPAEDGTLGRDRLLRDRRPATRPRALLHAPAAGARSSSNACTCGPPAAASAFTATNNPPLFYALQAVPYKLAGAAGGSVLDRLAAMRIALGADGRGDGAAGVPVPVASCCPAHRWRAARARWWRRCSRCSRSSPRACNNDALLYLAADRCAVGHRAVFKRGLTPANGAIARGVPGLRPARQADPARVRAGRRGWRSRSCCGAAFAAASPASSPAPPGRSGSAAVPIVVVLRAEPLRVAPRHRRRGVSSTATSSPSARHFSRLRRAQPHLAAVPARPVDAPRSSPPTSAVEDVVHRRRRALRLARLQFPLWLDDLALVLADHRRRRSRWRSSCAGAAPCSARVAEAVVYALRAGRARDRDRGAVLRLRWSATGRCSSRPATCCRCSGSTGRVVALAVRAGGPPLGSGAGGRARGAGDGPRHLRRRRSRSRRLLRVSPSVR